MEKKTVKKNIPLKNILSNIPTGIYWKNLDGNYLGCNEYFAKLVELPSPNEIIGKTDSELILKNQNESISKNEAIALESGMPQRFEESIVKSDKSKLDFHITITPLRDDKRDIYGIIGIFNDITERKNREIFIEKAKIKAESYLDNIIRYLPANVYWKSKEGVILGCNDRLAHSTGLAKAEDLIGKTDDEFSWKDQAEAIRKNDADVMTTGSSITFEELGTMPDGSVHTFLTIKAPMRDKPRDTIIGVLGISVDITDRKKAEEELRHAKERAEIADKLKLDFIHNMEHDIRTPFCGVWGLAVELEKEETDPEKKMLITAIKDSAKLLLDYCNNILEFSKIEDGSNIILEKKFNIKELIHDVVTLETPAAKIKNLIISANVSDDVPTILIGDPIRLQKILINLVGNAVKFTKTGKVETSIILVKKEESKKVILKFFIEDTGIGINQEKQNLIYEKFMRGTPSNKGLYQGLGLGLYIVKQYIEDLGGEIDVASEEEKGTTFICTIPFRLPLVQSDPTEPKN